MVDYLFEYLYVYTFKNKYLKKFINSIILTLIPSILKRKGVFLALNPKDPVVSGALLFNVFENNEINILKKLIKPDTVFLDIGANIGLYTAIVGKLAGQKAKIISFEPDPISYKFLIKTIKLNNLKNCTALNFAASNKNSTMKLYVSKLNGGDNRMYLDKNSNDFEMRYVKAINVSSYLLMKKINQINLIKIDVQGYEYIVFLGLEKLIKKSKNLYVLTEFWPYGIQKSGSNPLKFIQYLASLGFTILDTRSNEYIYKKDYIEFIRKYAGRKYTNLLLFKDR